MNSSSSILETIAKWAFEVSNRWTDHCISSAHHAFTDTVACMVSGAEDDAAQRVRATMTASSGSGGKAVVICGEGDRLPAPFAAYANGTAAQTQDYDDNFAPALTHASAILVPALLALGEEVEATGAQLVDAYLVGLECQAVIGQGVNRSHYLKGWHSTATVGCIGTAAACARLLGLRAAHMTHAMSIAVSMAGGVRAQFGSQVKPLHSGMTAHNAVMAARLAQNGVQGRLDVMEAKHGFLDLFGGDAPAGWDFAQFPIGTPHVITDIGLAPKRHPCCGSAHMSIDNLLDLIAKHKFEAGDVTSIHARVNMSNLRNLSFSNPQNEMEARFSLQYSLAVALKNGFLSLNDFTPEAVWDPAIRELLGLTTMSATAPEAEFDPKSSLTHELTVTLKDGNVLTASRALPRGTLNEPFSDEDRWRKFQDCCQRAFDPQSMAQLYEQLLNLSEQTDIRPLMDRFTGSNGVPVRARRMMSI